MAAVSPFLDPGASTSEGQLALIHLKRDLLTPVILETSTTTDTNRVINTRFGSFPHSNLVDIPWGTQVRAAVLDHRGRGKKSAKKRKREDDGGEDGAQPDSGAATSGFAHIVPPTPETWTTSLPHRTQVVYTPDYSYVLQRLRVRPGDTLIEAGAGSGSFTHAAVRAVFNGYPAAENGTSNGTTDSKKRKKRQGHVYSFEFHEQRAEKLREELKEHRIDPLVTVTHADVYEDGFNKTLDGAVPQADAVFLDLPAPWMAVKHLSRTQPAATKASSTTTTITGENTPQAAAAAAEEDNNNSSSSSNDDSTTWRSPLNPRKTIRLCTFSPCIEQVQRTTTELRRLGWTNIEMVEVLQRRIDVRRERIGLQEEGLRGTIPLPATVDEALGRLREVEGRLKLFHESTAAAAAAAAANAANGGAATAAGEDGAVEKGWGKESKGQRLLKIKEAEKERKTYREGRLVHRTEPDIKTHTSYLCFALLPREWSEADEEKARRKWEGAGEKAAAA
ncbi:S-adenosyl-L-methionine-dependent methyltransferase [Phyllosticta citriasiana]|uniref:tRNA (adenine(58)-N(1))-methyltransferase catalytic subunit TRM61 n=1 Tax=Phyllosticta citriasiana TaxID=595635 RepID=A0ABR1KAE4_9PEZI